jgi:PAS domain S-box-containing protein
MTTMHPQRRPGLPALAEILAAGVALALLTWAADRLRIRAEPAALLYLCLVVVVSLRGRMAPALLVAIGGTVAWDYFFTGAGVALSQRQFRDVVTLLALVATAVVITRLVRALRTSEGRWRNVFENNPVMYFMIDASGTVLAVNAKGAEQLGYRASELVGQPVVNVFLEEDKAAAREHVARCLTRLGESLSWQLRKIHKDGRMLWVRETARAVQLGSEPPVVLIACEDISESKEAQEKLRRSEARLRGHASLLDLTHDAIFVRDLNDVIRYWNRGAAEQYGWSSEEAVGQVSHELLKTAFPEPLDAITETLDRTGRWDGELVHTKRDGTRIVVATRWSLQRDEKGIPGGILETNNDVTEKKQAEEERRGHLWFLESMDRMNRAMQGSRDLEQMTRDVLAAVRSIFDCDAVSLTYPCDPDAASFRVVMRDTRPGNFDAAIEGVREFPVDEDTARLVRIARASNGPVRFDPTSEHRLDALRTKHFGVQSALAMALYPKVDAPYLFWIQQVSRARVWTSQEERLFQDIGRRLADALTSLLVVRDLRESERRHRNIFQAAAVSIWEEDFSRIRGAIEELRAQGVSDFRRYFAENPDFVAQAVQMVRVIDVNDATLRLFDAGSKDELVGSLHRVFTPETFGVFAGELLAVAEGRPFFAAETTLKTRGGERLDVLFTIAFPPEPTKLESVLVSIMDATGRKRAEEALHRAQTELARASTLTTMGQLAGSIAHELRQPLAAIAMNGSAALRWLNRASPDLGEAREAAARVVRDAERADEVIRGLRALLGKSDTRREPLDMNAAIYEVLELARGELRRSGVSVHTDLALNLPPTLGDRVQLQQVLLNLIVNAIEAMAPAANRPKVIVIRTARAEPAEVAVAVEDTGAGLEPATADRIFHPFFTTKPSGLGMGLSICRSIVEAHGGQLSASPGSPHGSTFRFTIPTVLAGAASSSAPASPPPVGRATVSPPRA